MYYVFILSYVQASWGGGEIQKPQCVNMSRPELVSRHGSKPSIYHQE